MLLLHFVGAISYLLICLGYPSVDESFRLHHGPLIIVFFLLATMVPFLFMLLSRSFFIGQTSVPIWAVVLLTLQVTLELANFAQTNCDYELTSACTSASRDLNFNTLVFVLLPSLIAALFFALAMVWTLKDWKTDLVEKRRQFRRGFAALLGLFGMVMIVSEDISLYFYPASFPLVSNIDSISIALFFILSSLVLLSVDTAAIMAELVVRPSTQPVFQNEELPNKELQNEELILTKDPVNLDLGQLQEFLENSAYRQPGLNVAKLASKLSMPQYRLRQLINQEMGFRNFNTFLNSYRIADACQQLSDPTKAEVAILDIAMDVGFGSITSFNDAFKKQLNTTPTAFRKEKLG